MPTKLPGELGLPAISPAPPTLISPLRSAVTGIGAAADAIAQFEGAMAKERARLDRQEQTVELRNDINNFFDSVDSDPDDLDFLERFDAQFRGASQTRSLEIGGNRFAQEMFRNESSELLNTARTRLSGTLYQRQATKARTLGAQASITAATTAHRLRLGQEAGYLSIAAGVDEAIGTGAITTAEGDDFKLLGYNKFDVLDVRRHLALGNYQLVLAGLNDKRWQHLNGEQESAAFTAAQSGSEQQLFESVQLRMIDNPVLAIRALMDPIGIQKYPSAATLVTKEDQIAFNNFIRDYERIAPRLKNTLHSSARVIQQNALSSEILLALEQIGPERAETLRNQYDDKLDPILNMDLARSIASAINVRTRNEMARAIQSVREHNRRMLELTATEQQRLQSQVNSDLERAEEYLATRPFNAEEFSQIIGPIDRAFLEALYAEGRLTDGGYRSLDGKLTQIAKSYGKGWETRQRAFAIEAGSPVNIHDNDDREIAHGIYQDRLAEATAVDPGTPVDEARFSLEFSAHHQGFIDDDTIREIEAGVMSDQTEDQVLALERLVLHRQVTHSSEIDRQFSFSTEQWQWIDRYEDLRAIPGVPKAEAWRNAQALTKENALDKGVRTSRHQTLVDLGAAQLQVDEDGEPVPIPFEAGDPRWYGDPGAAPKDRGSMGWYWDEGLVYDVIKEFDWQAAYGPGIGGAIRTFFTKDLREYFSEKVSVQHLRSNEALRNWAVTARDIFRNRFLYHGSKKRAAREAVAGTLGNGMFAMEHAFVEGDPVLRRGGTGWYGDGVFSYVDPVPNRVWVEEDAMGALFYNARHIFEQPLFPWDNEPGSWQSWNDYLETNEAQPFLKRIGGAAAFALMDMQDPQKQAFVASLIHMLIQTGRWAPGAGILTSPLARALQLEPSTYKVGGPDIETVRGAVADWLRIEPAYDDDEADLSPIGSPTVRVRADRTHTALRAPGMEQDAWPMAFQWKVGDRWLEINAAREDPMTGRVVQMNEPLLWIPSKKLIDEQGKLLPPGEQGSTYSMSLRRAYHKNERNKMLAQADGAGFFSGYVYGSIAERMSRLPSERDRRPGYTGITSESFSRALSGDPILRAHLARKLVERPANFAFFPAFSDPARERGFVGTGIGYDDLSLGDKGWLAKIDAFLGTTTDPEKIRETRYRTD